MNPVFDPGTVGAPQFAPGGNPSLFSANQLASTGDPGTVGGGGGGQLAQTPATAGGSVPQDQWNTRDQSRLGKQTTDRPAPTPFGWLANTNAQHYAAPSWYTPPAAVQPTGWNASNYAAAAAWDPAMHPGRSRPTPTAYRGGHVTPAGMDWTRFANAGNMGMSAPGSRTPTGNLPNFPGGYEALAAELPWMTDTSVQWGGGPGGYLPIGYQPQNYAYYANTQNLAPWEQRYMADTWTQNYDKDQPGFINTQRGSRNPEYYNTLRG